MGYRRRVPADTQRRRMARCNLRLHGTRGAAVAVAQIDTGRETLRFAGAGNISACIIDGEVKHIASHNGIVGITMRRAQDFLIHGTRIRC